MLAVHCDSVELSFYNLPHLDESILQNPNDLDTTLASAARKYIMSQELFIGLRRLADAADGKFRLLYHTYIPLIDDRLDSDAKARGCLCEHHDLGMDSLWLVRSCNG